MAAVSKKSSLLLEIGTEEIPARFLPPAILTIKEKATAFLVENSIEFSTIRTYGTPRRLALFVDGIPPVQRDRVREVIGPPRKVAFDSSGNPSQAAIGFAASQGVDVSALQIRKMDRGEYMVAVSEEKGTAVNEILPDILEKVIRSLHFPKSMRWGDGNLRFVRPIHWILAICDGEVIPFSVDGIRSANLTKGHRFLSPGSFVLKEIPSYIHLMENNYVIVDQETRKRTITEGIVRLSASVEGVPLADEALLTTVTYLTEYPVPFLCEFPLKYLRLPKELLITVMKDHQKFFAVEDGGGRLKNHFIVISNTKEENAKTVKAGAERVIKARFEDARFYYEEDLRIPLHTRLEAMRRVTFHDRLGSLADKTERVVKIASFLSSRLCPEKRELIERAARLSKADLLSGVVGEFPELQGLMGKYYAENEGENKAVADAIMEQYLPAYSGDRLPETDEGSIISLADKIDNIVSFFSIGTTPTGSEDPFALRRQALAVIAILIDKEYPLTLSEIFGKTEAIVKGGRPSLNEEVLQFFLQRFEPLLSSQNFSMDVIQSVLHLGGELALADLKKRLIALMAFTAESGFNPFLLAMKRINNIIPDIEIPPIEETLLTEHQEKMLFGDTMNVRPVIQEMLRSRKYYEAIKTLSFLTGPVNSFFDDVLVMDKREEVKLNRLALLNAIWDIAMTIADFSKLTERAQS